MTPARLAWLTLFFVGLAAAFGGLTLAARGEGALAAAAASGGAATAAASAALLARGAGGA